MRRVILAAAAVVALAAAAGVAVVAASFALYALLRPVLGEAGAAGAVAGGFAALLALGGLMAGMKARPRHPKGKGAEGDTVGRLIQLAREQPIVAAGALVALGMAAMRNPAITALVMKSFFDSKKPPPKR